MKRNIKDFDFYRCGRRLNPDECLQGNTGHDKTKTSFYVSSSAMLLLGGF